MKVPLHKTPPFWKGIQLQWGGHITGEMFKKIGVPRIHSFGKGQLALKFSGGRGKGGIRMWGGKRGSRVSQFGPIISREGGNFRPRKHYRPGFRVRRKGLPVFQKGKDMMRLKRGKAASLSPRNKEKKKKRQRRLSLRRRKKGELIPPGLKGESCKTGEGGLNINAGGKDGTVGTKIPQRRKKEAMKGKGPKPRLQSPPDGL